MSADMSAYTGGFPDPGDAGQGLSGVAVIDPVCGAPVFPDDSTYFARYLGDTFYFCSLACMERFERDPYTFLATDRSQGLDEFESLDAG